MYSPKKQCNFYQPKLSSLISKSKEEFLREYRKYDEARAQKLYFEVLTDVEKAVSVANIDSLKSMNRIIGYISSVTNKVKLQSYFDNADNPIRNTNLVILACKHNKVKVLEYVFGNDMKILNNLYLDIGLHTALPSDRDDECHNAFYYAVRSGNIELLETLIDKWPCDYFVDNSYELDELLSKAYDELKLRNVKLTDDIEIFVENRLINLRFFADDSVQFENVKVNITNINERIELLLKNITLLKDLNIVDEQFLLVVRFIAQNIHVLKRQLKSTYDSLPWEEIEFCLIGFVTSYTNHQETNLFYLSVLTKHKILSHLEHFSNNLIIVKSNIEKINVHKLVELPKLNREKVVANIIKNSPVFEELYNDYIQIMDVYSLEKINSYIELALSADSAEKEEQLVIIRALQVIGEYLKNTLESPKLSSCTSKLLLLSLPKNTRKIVADLRNSLSHYDSLSKRIELEENGDVSFFNNVQNDMKTISIVIVDILYNNKIKIIRMLISRIINSEHSDEIKEIAKAFQFVKLDKMLMLNVKLHEYEKIEQFVQELSYQINDKTCYETELFNQINKIIHFEKTKLDNAKTDYMSGFFFIKFLCEQVHNKIDHNSIRVLKYFGNKVLENITPKVKLQSFKDIAMLSTEISISVTPRMNYENLDVVNRLVWNIILSVEFEIGNVKWITELRDKLNKSKLDKDSINVHKQKKNCNIPEKNNNQLTIKLSTLKDVLNTNALCNQLIDTFPSYKSDKKLQAVIEMLVLDIMSILDSSKKYLTNNLLFLDIASPLLIGKSLRNHLAHGNALLDILQLDSSTAVIVNARKLATENVIKFDKKIGKLISNNVIELQSKYDQDLVTVSNQKEMFIALTEGNLDHLKACLKQGADINALGINLSTALHFAAKGSNLDVVKFVLDQNLSINVKDINGQTPLHVAAAFGRKRIVKFFVQERCVDFDDQDNAGKTSLHIAAQNGHKNIVKVLLKNKASTMIKDTNGYSPLHYAIENNYKDVANIMLVKERNVDSNEACGGCTSLHIAAENGFLELVNFLLENKANVNAKSDAGGIPLHAAALNGHLEVVKALILKGSNVNAKTIDGGTVLHYAVENGHEQVVQILLQHGAKVNAVDNTYRCAPLNCAAKNGNYSIVEVLLKNKADVNTATIEGITPLHLSALSGHHDVVSLLINNKVSVNAHDTFGSIALHFSAVNGHINVVRLLIKNGAEINAKDKNLRTPLHVAAGNGYIEVVEALIMEGAHIDSADTNGYTALHLSSVNGHNEIVKFLLHRGAKVNAMDNNKKTPLQVAAEKDIKEVIDILIGEGGDINSTDKYGLTALHIAALSGNKKVVDILIDKNADVNTKCQQGCIPLHLAVQGNHGEVTKVLIKKGSQIDAKQNNGRTPLYLAVKNNYKDIVNILITNGADVNTEGGEPLTEAVFAGYKDIVDILLKHKKINSNMHVMGNTLLQTACLRGHTSIVEALLSKGIDVDAVSTVKSIGEALLSKGIDVDAVSTVSNATVTPLILAASKGHREVVEVLLKKKANVNSKVEGDTSLHKAAVQGYSNVAQVLLDHHANVNIKNSKNITPIELAVAYSHLQIVKMLYPHTLDINAYGNDGWTILHIAAQKGNLQIVRYLIDKGADINARNKYGSKPIHIAAREGHQNVIEFFLNCKLGIDELGAAGWTLLHYAAAGGQSEVVQYLIEQKINVNMSDENGSKPIHIGSRGENKDVVKILLNNGAYYNSLDKFDKKPIQVANNKKIVSLLTSTEKLFEAVIHDNPLDVERCIKRGACIDANNVDRVSPLHYGAGKGYGRIVDILLKHKANPNIVGKGGCTPLHYATKFGHLGVVKALLISGAMYNVLADNLKIPLDFAVHQGIVDLLKLVSESFSNVQNGNSKVINDLKKIKDVDIVKAVMNARDRENKTLVVTGICNGFQKIEQLKQIFQDNVSTHIALADILLAQEKYEEALNAFRMVLEKRTELFGPDNPATLDIQLNVANILYKQQKYQRAFIIFEEIYQTQTEILGKNNKDTLNTRSNMALVLYSQGKYKEALNIYEEVYQKQKEILGVNDFDILNTESNMAVVLDSLEKYDEALKINYEVFEKRKAILGINDPETLCTMNNIAMVLNNQGNHDEAIKMYKKVYETSKVVSGPNHSATLRTLHNMAGVLFVQQKYDEALKGYEEVYYIQRANLGPNHIDTLNTQHNIADLLLSQGKILGALKKYKEGFEQRKAILGSNHPDILDTLAKMESINMLFTLQGDERKHMLEYSQDVICIAASSGDKNAVKTLIENGIDVNARDFDGRTPLHFAVNDGHDDVIDLLLKSGADCTLVTYEGNTPLHTAASKGYNEIVKVLLRHVKQSESDKFHNFIDAKTLTGMTALHVAAKNGSDDVVTSFLEHGAIYNCTEYSSDKTPLDLSKNQNITNLLKLTHKFFKYAKAGNNKIANKLCKIKPLEFLAVTNARNNQGNTLLQVAIINKHKDIEHKLIEMLN